MKRALFLALLFATVAFAQCTATMTAPTASATMGIGNGPPVYTLTSSTSGCTNIYSADYVRDGGERIGITRTPPYSYIVDPYATFNNGQHWIWVVYRDVLNNILAASPAVQFSVENNLPQNTCPPNGAQCTDISVTQSTVAEMGTGTNVDFNAHSVSFYAASGAPTIVGGAPCGSGASTGTINCGTTTAGHTLVFFTSWQSSTGTLNPCTITGGAVGTAVYDTPEQNAGGFSSQVVHIYNIAGGASSQVSCTTTAGSFQASMMFELAGTVTTNPIDVDNVCSQATGCSSTSTNPVITGPIAFTQPATNELLLIAVRFGGNVTPTAGIGFSHANIWQVGATLGVEAINPPGAIWGAQNFVATVNGPNSGISKYFRGFIDGVPVYNPSNTTTTAASVNFTLNTTNWLNTAAHQIYIDANGGTCPGCTVSQWVNMGSWEPQQETFANIVTPAFLLLSCRQCLATPSGSPITVTGTDINTDGSQTAATLSSCTAAAWPDPTGTTYFSVTASGGNCVVTPTANAGINYVTATDSNGLTEVFWPEVLSSGELPIANFTSTTGTQVQGYNANSIWYAGAFSTTSEFTGPGAGLTSSQNPAIAYAPALAAIGQNYIDFSLETASNSDTPTTFDAKVLSDITTIQTNFSAYGKGMLRYVNLLGNSYAFSSTTLGATLLGPGSALGANWISQTSPMTRALNAWAANGASSGYASPIASNMCDECNWGSNPLGGTDTGGYYLGSANGPSSLTGNGTTCTLAWSNPYSQAAINGGRLIVTGSGQSTLDYNGSTNANMFVTTQNTNSITWPCTYNSSTTSSSVFVHPWAYGAYTANFTTSGSFSTDACAPVGTFTPSSGTPCTQYIDYNALLTFRQWWTAASPHPAMIWSTAGGGSFWSQTNYSGQRKVNGVSIGDGATPYATFSGQYQLDRYSLFGLINGSSSVGYGLLANLNSSPRTNPTFPETQGVVNDYSQHGYPVPLVSCVGNTLAINTSGLPNNSHGLYNVLPEFSKVWVSGSSGGGCDGNYYIIASPTGSTLSGVLANPTSTSINATGGTITFADGNSYALCSGGGCTGGASYGIQLSTSSTSNVPNQMSLQTSTCAWKQERGQTFTISGTNSATVNAMTGWFDSGYNVAQPCGGSGAGDNVGYWRQIPNLSATGGTAYIIPSAYSQRGGGTWNQTFADDPAEMFATVAQALIEDSAGHRRYTSSIDVMYSDQTLIGTSSAMSATVTGFSEYFPPASSASLTQIQLGLNPVAEMGEGLNSTIVAAQSEANLNLFAEAKLKYIYGTRLNAPDLGCAANPYFWCSARTSAAGNVLLRQSFLNNSAPCTVNLSPYLVSGQPILDYVMEWSAIKAIRVIAAGTATDTQTCAPGQFDAYVFPNIESAELNQPSISVRLADVTNATDVVIQYSYSPLSFASPSVASQTLYQTYDCGTGSCTLPADRNIGTIYYRIIYYGSGNAVLATSDVQTL